MLCQMLNMAILQALVNIYVQQLNCFQTVIQKKGIQEQLF